MGRIFLLEFDDQLSPDYYMCKLCRTHIALQDDYVLFHMDLEMDGNVFRKAINLQVDRAVYHYQVDENTVADAYCVKCGDKLGRKYIQIRSEQMILKDGYVKLLMNKLLRMHGNIILDAETMDPVPESP